MADSVSIYLNDHLAGAAHALDLLEHLQKNHQSDHIGPFAGRLLVDVRADYETLKDIAGRVNAGSNAMKEVLSRLSEKIARLKLGDNGAIAFETFESLEFLVLGIHGKLALWRALEATSANDVRLRNVDYSLLVERAQQQEAVVEAARIDLAKKVLLPPN